MDRDRGAWFLIAAGLILAITCAAARCAEPVLLHDWKQDGNKRTTSWGTAFGIGDGKILTALHTIKGGTLEIKEGERWIPATVIARDEGLDLALLQSAARIDAFKLADSAGPSEPYTIAGFPGGVRKTINARVDSVSGSRVSLRTAGFGHGFSGAPVLNKAGCVVGVAVSGDKGPDGDIDPATCNAIHLLEIQAFLRRVIPASIPPEYTAGPLPQTRVELVPEPRKASAKLLAAFASGADWRAVRTAAGVVWERAESDALGERSWRRAAPQYEDPEWSRAAIAALVTRE
jgi:hypothetical protein